MINKKADNQWFGKQFERLICDIKNNSPIVNYYPNHIKENELIILIHDAKEFLKQYEENEPIQSIEWIGNHTITADGDLIINGQICEIKRVQSGLGTWCNSTINNLYKYINMPTHIDYMEKYGMLDFLRPYAGSNPRWVKNRKTPNPINDIEEKSLEKDPKAIAEWQRLDDIWRPKFIHDVYQNFLQNPELMYNFVEDCLTKKVINKQMPKSLCVFNYKKQKLYAISNGKLLKQKNNLIIPSLNEKGIYFGPIRISIYWKNDYHNLAMNIFLEA